MKTKYFVRLSLILVFILSLIYNIQSQPCKFKKSDCEMDELGEDVDIFGEYDYRSQSAYAQMSPGDKQEVRFVVYRGKDYQVFTCQDMDLGDVQFQIIKPQKRTERVIKDIKVTEETKYKTDEEGNILYKKDEFSNDAIDEKTGLPIPEQVLGTVKKYDTIWETKQYTEETVWFDSNSNKEGTKIWKYDNVQQTTTLRARIIVPDGDPEYIGCVSILIGFRHTNYNKFVRGTTTAD
ncbi:MAG: hypothetical protein HY738_06405 [Bacteroidia bacterium]|nr:hypothetical protein [Bacteroidia bacterium]